MEILIKNHKVWKLEIVKEFCEDKHTFTVDQFDGSNVDPSNCLSKQLFKKVLFKPFINGSCDRSIYCNFDQSKQGCGFIEKLELTSSYPKKVLLSAVLKKDSFIKKEFLSLDNDFITKNVSFGPSWKYSIIPYKMDKMTISDVKFVCFGISFSDELKKYIKVVK